MGKKPQLCRTAQPTKATDLPVRELRAPYGVDIHRSALRPQTLSWKATWTLCSHLSNLQWAPASLKAKLATFPWQCQNLPLGVEVRRRIDSARTTL